MTIMVDTLVVWSKKPPFHKGSCHLTTDGDIDELHAFAAKLGMKRAWFQDHPILKHYDLTPSKRALAVKLGAVEVSGVEQARRRSVIAKRLAGEFGRTHFEAKRFLNEWGTEDAARAAMRECRVRAIAWLPRNDAGREALARAEGAKG